MAHSGKVNDEFKNRAKQGIYLLVLRWNDQEAAGEKISRLFK